MKRDGRPTVLHHDAGRSVGRARRHATGAGGRRWAHRSSAAAVARRVSGDARAVVHILHLTSHSCTVGSRVRRCRARCRCERALGCRHERRPRRGGTPAIHRVAASERGAPQVAARARLVTRSQWHDDCPGAAVYRPSLTKPPEGWSAPITCSERRPAAWAALLSLCTRARRASAATRATTGRAAP